MRNLQAKLIPGMMVLLVAGGAALGEGQNAVDKSIPPDPAKATPTKNTSPAKPEKPKPSELEQMLTEALVNNPDIRVAEAKLREAEAELNRVRLQALQKLGSMHHSLEMQRAAVKGAEASLEQAESNRARGVNLLESTQQLQALLAKEKAKLAALETELPLLLGRPPQATSANKRAAESGEVAAKSFFQLYDVPGTLLKRYAGWHGDACTACHDGTAWKAWPEAVHSRWHWAEATSQSPGQSAQGVMADKIRKALDSSVRVDIKGKSLTEAVKVFEEKAPGISFHTVVPSQQFSGIQINLHLEQVPLGAALQALEDTYTYPQGSFDTGGLRLAVREYGLLITTRGMLPPGATLLHDFWKGQSGKAKGSTPSDNIEDKSHLPDDIEGAIKATDPKSGLVTINIGSDAGLHKGDSLEVYRLKPEPIYLGSIQILSVTPTEAVAKPTREPRVPLVVGDRIATAIRRR
jgi:hypothetical protein